MKKINNFCIVIFSFWLISCQKDEPAIINTDNKLKDVDFWAYQIDDIGSTECIDAFCNSHYDLLVIDQQRSIKGSESHNTRADIIRIKNSQNSKGGKKRVVCYFDVGQVESYRYYWQAGWEKGRPDWILDPDPDGWNNSYGVKFWSPEWKAIMKDYIGRIIDDGYDGVYLDWLMIYSFAPVVDAAHKDGVDVTKELISFIRELSAYAREKSNGFIFIAQNAAELGIYPEYVKLFDAIAQEDIWYDGSGDPDNGGNEGDSPMGTDDTQSFIKDLQLWQSQGKPVFNVEYAQKPENVSRAYSLGKQYQFKTYVTLRLLNKLTTTPPPNY